MSEKNLLEAVSDTLKEMDKDITPVSESYAEAVLLVASAINGADENSLASELGFEPEFVHLVGSRLRSSGIWNGKALNPARLKQWCEDSIGFYLDLNVASGRMIVVGKCGSGETKFQMTEGGQRAVEAMKRSKP